MYVQPTYVGLVIYNYLLPTYLGIGLVLYQWINPSISYPNPLQVLGIDRIALNDDLRSGRNIVAS